MARDRFNRRATRWERLVLRIQRLGLSSKHLGLCIYIKTQSVIGHKSRIDYAHGRRSAWLSTRK